MMRTEVFAKRLCEVLKQNQMSQSELARRIKLSYDAVNKYCLGKHEPSLETLREICVALNEKSDYLIGLTD